MITASTKTIRSPPGRRVTTSIPTDESRHRDSEDPGSHDVAVHAQRTHWRPRVAPEPMTEPEITWVVESGMPKWVRRE